MFKKQNQKRPHFNADSSLPFLSASQEKRNKAEVVTDISLTEHLLTSRIVDTCINN